MPSVREAERVEPKRRRRGVWGWIAVVALLAVVVLAGVGEVMVHRAGPILKGRVVETLSTRFKSRVELDDLEVSLVDRSLNPGLNVAGKGLRIFAPEDVVAAGFTRPLIAIRAFSFHANLEALWVRPTHVSVVHVSGLEIHIPPRQMRQGEAVEPKAKHGGKIEFLVDQFFFTDSRLVIDQMNPAKEPKVFELEKIDLARVGPDTPLRYDATLVNAIPKGNIHAVGAFGPWDAESPGDSMIQGHYTFENADLYPIKGIGGTLNSVGDFRGELNRIEVFGRADVPNFSLDEANEPVRLSTVFHAVVDGTTGDTYLNDVQARLRESAFTCKGQIVTIRGKGHVIDLDVDVPNGRVQDFLALAVKTRPVLMTASFTTKAKLHLGPGKEPVMQKVAIHAGFTLRGIRFSNPKFQDRVDELSMRAQGRPAEATADAPVVGSQMTGQMVMGGGTMHFDKLDYTVPGVQVGMTGIYSLDGEQFDFHGTVRTQAKASEMVKSWWQQLLLKPVDRLLEKNGAGMEIPFKVSGAKSDPKFGLDFGRDKK